MKLFFALALLAALPAAGLEELWRYDLGCGLPHLPVVMNFNGQPGRCVYVSSRLSSSIEVLSAQGNLVATFQRPRTIAAGIAADAVLDQLLFEEDGGQLVLLNRLRPENFVAETDDAPAGGFGPAFADLDGDSLPEVLRANNHGTLCAYDRRMAPLWQYHTGQPLAGGIGAAPLFEASCGVYLACSDGTIHAVAGNGMPMWRRQLPTERFQTGVYHRPLVIQNNAERPSLVLITDSGGTIYALDAAGGQILWSVDIGQSDAGIPAVVDRGEGGRRIVVVCERGMTATLDEAGNVVARGVLPENRYVPCPLAADVDGDGQVELLVAAFNHSLVVATLDGRVKETLPLPGIASQGMILSDIDRDAFLELLTVCDCGRVVCHKTAAGTGWRHPAANPAMNGAVPRLDAPATPLPAPAPKRARRSVRVESVTVRDFVEHSPYGAAFVRARLPGKAETAAAVIRRKGEIVGSTLKAVSKDGFYVPFIQISNEPLTLDLCLYDGEGKPVASSSNVMITPGPVRLVGLDPIEDFLETLAARADAFRVPPAWKPPVVAGKDYWDLTGLRQNNETNPVLSVHGSPNRGVLPSPLRAEFCEIGGPHLYAPMQFAIMRGAARQAGGAPWGVNICPQLCAAEANPTPRGPDWERRVGSPPQLALRLQTAAYLSGATYVDRLACEGNEFAHADVYSGARGTPYTPIAFRTDAGAWPGRRGGHADAMMQHVYEWKDAGDIQLGHLTSGPYGDIFDIVDHTAGAADLGRYGVVWMFSDAEVEKTEAEQLLKYVEDGGILVVDGRVAAAIHRRIHGIQFTREIATGTQIQTALAATAPVDAPFRYRVINPVGMRTLAWTDAAHPLVMWRPLGRGMLIIGANDGWVDEIGHLLPVGEALLRTLTDAFMPVQVPPNFEVLLNRTDDGWIIGAINNTPAYKPSGESPILPVNETAECILRFKKGSVLKFISQMGRFQWNNAAGGLTATLQPGEVGVVSVTVME